MNFFNFKLTEDSYAKEPIKIPKEISDKLPKDYVEFLINYNNMDVKDGDGMNIDILGREIPVGLYDYEDVKRLDKNAFPDCYFPIADNYEFEGFIMSLRKKDFGHVYYIDLETWQIHVLELEDENEKIKNIDKHCIHIANSFSEFTHQIYDKDRNK